MVVPAKEVQGYPSQDSESQTRTLAIGVGVSHIELEIVKKLWIPLLSR